MTTEIAPGGGTIANARLETRACGGATSSDGRECPATPHVPVQTLLDLIARIDREWCDESAASTPGGRALVGGDLARDLGWRAGWNAARRSLRAALVRICDEHAPSAPVSDIEAREIIAAERREHERTERAEQSERDRLQRWAFEFDVEQDAISEAYERELGGEGG